MGAARAALADAEIAPRRLGLVVISNALGEALCDQASIRGQSWLRAMSFEGAPVVNVENACAGGASALHVGWLAAQAGTSPVLVLGVEKMWTGDRWTTLRGIEGSLPAEDREPLRSSLGDASGSIFMALNASWASRQLTDGRATLAQFASAAVKARRHAALNPLAQHREPVSTEQVLGSPLVADPLTRLMCSSFTDGAAAAVLAPSNGEKTRILASVLVSGDGSLEYHDRLGATASIAWEKSGLGPADLDMVEVHDATSAEELYALESLGFFAAGEAGPATERGGTTYGGTVVVNPSGGLLARGHALGATGVCQVIEAVIQLRSQAGSRQVEGARAAALVNTGGIVDGDAASVGVHVLAS